MNQRTLDAIGWKEVWQQFQPCTPYGQRAKAGMVPFLPGEESAWQASLSQLRQDLCGMDETAIRALREAAATLPDIEDALGLLAASNVSLSIKQLLLMKQFAYRGWRSCRALAPAINQHGGSMAFSWPSEARWRSLLDAFGEEEEPSPTLDLAALGGDLYQEAAAAHAMAVHKRALAVRERDKAWFDKTGHRPTRDGRLTVLLPEHKRLAESLKSLDGLCWVKETPFESVFQVLPTPAMEESQAAVEAQKQALQTMETRIMVELCATLRGSLPIWRQIVDIIADIDVRSAKVVLAHSWSACVPEQGDLILIQDGVHPLVAQRLKKSGKSYVPLTMELQHGANVVGGSNMGGKSVILQLVTLCQLLAQYAMPVPAKTFQAPLLSAVRLLEGASTDTRHGLSAFGTEVVELTEAWNTAEAMAQSSQTVLLCFDEPGKSTNPVEGEALVAGLLRSAMQMKSAVMALVATHFAGVMQQREVRTYRVKGLKRLPDDAEIKCGVAGTESDYSKAEAVNTTVRLAQLSEAMDYHVELTNGNHPPTEGLRIARWLGLPATIQSASEQYLACARNMALTNDQDGGEGT